MLPGVCAADDRWVDAGLTGHRQRVRAGRAGRAATSLGQSDEYVLFFFLLL